MPTPQDPIPKLLSQAQSAARQGAFDKAETLYRDVLSRFPANRRAKNGLATLRISTPKTPQIPQAELDKVLALYNAGQHKAALKRAIALARNAPDLRTLWDIRAACYRSLGQPKKALQIYRGALDKWPRDAKLWRNCGTVLLDMLMFEDAGDCLNMATRLDPDDLMGWVGLGTSHEMRGHTHAAFDAASQALARDPMHVPSLNLLGRTLRDLGDLEAAAQAHELVLKNTNDPKHMTAALTSLGVLATATDQVDKACDKYRQAIAAVPKNLSAHLNLSRITRYGAADPHLAQLRALAGRDGLSLQEYSQLHFALFNALDQTEPGSDQAFYHLETGNRLRRKLLRYDLQKDAALFDRLEILTQSTPHATTTPQDAPRPIFIVGLPRSGTTLSEQILAAAPGVHGAGELPVVSNAVLALLKQLRRDGRRTLTTDDINTLADTLRHDLVSRAAGAPVIVDKMPLNFRWTSLILSALPEARIIHISRDAVETCWSNFRTYYASHGNGFTYDLKDLTGYHHLYSTFMANRHTQGDDRLYDLSYQSLISDPKAQISALLDFCELDWSDACLHPETSMRPVLTASAQQVRRPLYDGNSGSWRRYQTYLTPLLTQLGRAETPQK